MCGQWRFRSACAFAQADQNLYWAHFGSPLMQNFFLRTTKIMIRLHGCAGWFESSLGTHVRWNVYSRLGLFGLWTSILGSRTKIIAVLRNTYIPLINNRKQYFGYIFISLYLSGNSPKIAKLFFFFFFFYSDIRSIDFLDTIFFE